MNPAISTDRIASAVATVLMEALILYALLAGLQVVPPAPVSDALRIFTVVPPPPPPPIEPPPPPQPAVPKTRAPEGAASPPNIRSKATKIVAPKPVLRLPRPPPIQAAIKPDIGSASTSGAADVRGPGTGSGGIGEGTGSGRGGYGAGGGGRGGSPPRRISGRLYNSDYPRVAMEAGIEGTLTVVVTIEPNGRVSYCDVVRSSGSGVLDETTCRLVQQRYRYRPARDPDGRPVRSREMQNHSWVMEFEPPRRRS